MTDQTQQTVSVAEAAAALGISEDAILKRIRRGALTASKDQAGHWRVTLSPDTDQTDRTEQPDTGQEFTPTRQTHSGVSGGGKSAKQAALEADNARLQAALDEVRSERDYLRDRLADSLRIVEQQQALSLPDRMKDMPALTSEVTPAGGWFARWRARMRRER